MSCQWSLRSCGVSCRGDFQVGSDPAVTVDPALACGVGDHRGVSLVERRRPGFGGRSVQHLLVDPRVFGQGDDGLESIEDILFKNHNLRWDRREIDAHDHEISPAAYSAALLTNCPSK